MDMEQSATSLIVTCQQTRFHLLDAPASKEIDIKGLNITVTSQTLETAEPSKAKGKSKAKAEGLEIVSNAELRLKAGKHYALIGRNGTGKSTILRALSEKLIPGIPLNTRISILQQTAFDQVPSEGQAEDCKARLSDKPVLQQVVESDTYRNEILGEINILSKGIDDGNDPLSPVRALRTVHHERLRKELFEVHKAAKLRTGARGWDARKVLITYEKNFEESTAKLHLGDGELDNAVIQQETKDAVDLLADLQSQLESMKVVDIEAKARIILNGLGFKELMLEKKFSALSGGWRMRCMLASALTQTSDIIILDEPTNFLDLLGIIWLQRYLIDLRESNNTTVILVSHDRDFIDAVCEEVIILRDKTLTYFGGNLSAFEKDRKHQTLRLSRMQEAQDRQVAHMEKTIQNNIRVGKKTGDDNKLRQAKSRQKKVDERMGMQVSANGGRFKLNRDRIGYHNSSRAEIEIPKEDRAVNMVFPSAPDLRFPGSLVSLENVSFQYSKAVTKPILQDINLVLHLGDRVGIVGLNGCGKSTLIKLLVDEAKPSRGIVTRHSRLKLGYYSQHAVENLQDLGHSESTLTALALLMRQAEDYSEQQARQLLGSMGLTGRIASDVPVAKLSGGQLVRLALSLLLHSPPHLLVLDEITTHLDFHTVTALVHALSAYEGAILIVSHDRFLIRCVISGESPDPEGDSEDDEEVETDTKSLGSRHVVYELKNGKLLERSAGVRAFEESLEARVKKLMV